MNIKKLPSGRYRCRVSHEGTYHSPAKVLGLREASFRTKGEAREAGDKALAVLKGRSPQEITVREFWERWTSDPLFARPADSTKLHYQERTERFVETYGEYRLGDVGDFVVAKWLLGGTNSGTVPTLRIMFNDAMSAKAGRLITSNPFAGLGLGKSPGRKNQQPPSTEQIASMVQIARELTPPSFAAYLEFGGLTGGRPSELDALRWDRVRIEEGEVDLFEQFNAKTRKFTKPKYGPYTVALVARARDLLLGMPRQDIESPYVFVTNRGTHYTPSSRTHHWNRVRCAAGLPDTDFYLATRHYLGWYLLNVLELEPYVIAEQLGHKDGGKLVVQLYGHPDKAKARRRIREAFDSHAPAPRLRVVEGR